MLAEITTEELFDANRKIKGLKTKNQKTEEKQKAAINFTYEDGAGGVPRDETAAGAVDEDGNVDEDEDSDEDGPGIALIEEVMNPGLLSAGDKSIIDNKAMVSDLFSLLHLLNQNFGHNCFL